MAMQIKFDQVKADYQLGPIRTMNIIDDFSLQISQGTFSAVIGKTGAGKTSMLKLINGLLIPSSGSVQVGEVTINNQTKNSELNKIRKRVGIVFQFPENQLFAETVADDIAFGPKNFGFTRDQVDRVVLDSLKQVGLSEDLLSRSPFSLSGGQKRRVALAGVLATRPDILVLDEPGAGLDSEGKQEIFSLLKTLNQTESMTILVVTHDMNDVLKYADYVLLMDKGKLVCYEEIESFFSNQSQLERWDLDLPDVVHLQRQIEQKTGIQFKRVSLSKSMLIDQLIEEKLL